MTDPAVLRFNQAAILLLALTGVALGQPWLLAAVAAVMIAGSLEPRLALFKRLYADVLRPAPKLPRRLLEDDPRAHAFAQAFGGTVLAGAALALALGHGAVGLTLALVVVALALLNLTTGFCLGCQLYYHYRLLRRRLSR